ncbi:MAG: flagellar motor switch phosphatase FliY [Clostridia bacterium]|nr:flagellar motor switch phosphatase FliY [Clostridia bacterium]
MDNEMMSQTIEIPDDNTVLSLSSIEADTIGEILNISMGSAATAISTMLGRKVNITTPNVKVIKSSELSLHNLEPAIGIEIEYVVGLSGNNLLVMKCRDIKAIVNLLLEEMDEDEDGCELDEIHISAVSEIMNQMMGASSTALSSFLGKRIEISTPKLFDTENKMQEISNASEEKIVRVCFSLEVEDLLSSEFLTIMPIEFTKVLVKSALSFDEIEEAPVAKAVEAEPKSPPAPVKQTLKEDEINRAEAKKADTNKEKIKKEHQQKNTNEPPKAAQVSVTPLKFQVFEDDKANEEEEEAQHDNFNLILGVPLEVSVEIGKAKMSVKNVLDVRPGSIVELDKQAGDPVDVIVNGQLIAKGDVVVIDDNFGVRIVEILNNKGFSGSLYD